MKRYNKIQISYFICHDFIINLLFGWYYKSKNIMPNDLNLIIDIELDGVDFKDYPDFSDAYIYKAYWSNGIELTDKQIEQLNDNYNEFVYEKVINYIY